MAIGDVLKPATSMFGGVFSKLLHYSWVLWIFLFIGIAAAVVFFVYMMKSKKSQWTHRLKVRRVLDDNKLSDVIIHKMRRFPLVKKAEVFELEKPILGGYLIPELAKYTGVNEYSIIIDKSNRIWLNEGEYFCPDNSCINVSAKHAEIDIQRANLRANFQEINKINKRIDWGQIMKYALTAIMILAVMVVAIVGIGEWGDAQERKAESDIAFAAAMSDLSDAMKVMQATVNTQELLIPKIQELYGNKNIQGIIQTIKKNETN